MNGNQILGLVGLIIVIIGIFCPIVNIPLAGTLTYFDNGQGDGTIVLGIAAVTLICVFVNSDKGSILLTIVNLSLITAALINFQAKTGGSNPVQLQWGWALLIGGSILLLFGASEKNVPVVIGSIVIAGLLGGGIAYYRQYAEIEKLKNKAQADCEMLATASQKYYETEGREIETLNDLNEKYITNLETLKDSWGNGYEYDNIMKIIYSKGPDRKAKTSDDIEVSINKK